MHECLWLYVGTPVPLLPAAGTAFTSLAVEDTAFDDFSQAWAILGDEASTFSSAARCGLRTLSCAARCALTTLAASKENDAKAAQLVSDLKAAIEIFLSAEKREHKSKKRAEAEVRCMLQSLTFCYLLSCIALFHRSS
jgi:hypothetical protein